MTAEVISREQIELINRFIAAYNGIQKQLARELGKDPDEQLFRLIDAYAGTHRSWAGADGCWLRDIAPLRNVLVHDALPGMPYLAVPLPQVVDRIERILEGLAHPRTAYAAFGRDVLRLDVSTTIAEALRNVREYEYSQFPVYAGGRFRGLLTENGITRWLARISAHPETSIVDLEEQPVGVVLELEETQDSWRFARRDAPVDKIATLFAVTPLREAVLITHSGCQQEKLLGIATRWDVFAELMRQPG